MDGCVKASCFLSFASIECYLLQVKVVHVSNASHLWVYLLDHFPLTRGCSPFYFHDPMQFKRLTLDLAQYYSNKENVKYHGEYKP